MYTAEFNNVNPSLARKSGKYECKKMRAIA
jgi:hypothetical protein